LKEEDPMAERSESLVWRKRCGSQACVEVAFSESGVLIRDSSDPHGARLQFFTADWRTFLADLRADGRVSDE